MHEEIQYLLNKEWECYAITYCGRSGSYFLHTIFDGHKSILALPPWCTGIYNTFVRENRTPLEKVYVKSVESRFEDIILYLVSLEELQKNWEVEMQGASVPHNMFGENQDIKYAYDPNILKKNLNTVLSIAAEDGKYVSRKNLFLYFYIAYGMTIGVPLGDMLSKSVLLYQMHTLSIETLYLLRKDFPKLKHIIAAKNPVRSLLSHLQHYGTISADVGPCGGAIRNSFESGIIQPFMDDTNTIAIKVELLNVYQEAYTRVVLSHLGLTWDDACAKSTVNGNIFWWKKIDGTGISLSTGFNTKDDEDICRLDKISCEDKILLSHIFKERCEAWGYRICPAGKIRTLGRVFYREFDFFKSNGFSATHSAKLSQIIWEIYLGMRDKQVVYPRTIPFEYQRNDQACSVQQESNALS